MSSGTRSTDFFRLFRTSDKDLISDKFYDAMDSEFSNLDSYDQICNNKLSSNNKLDMIPICKKYLRFLDNYELWGDRKYQYDVSLLLNYWLYDKISNFYIIKNIDKISVDFSALQLIWDHFIENRNRKPYYEKFKPNNKIFLVEDWEKRRKLYEFYVNYGELFGIDKGYTHKCQEYYQKIEEMISVCAYFKEKCLESGTYNCPDNFNKCNEKDFKSELENFPCHRTIKSRRDSNSEGVSSHQLPRPEGPLVSTGGPATESNTQLESANSGIGNKVTHTVLGAAPVLLTATALYRYTPFGSWIRKIRGGSTNSMNAMEGFSPYTQESGDMFSDGTANYISYQPM